MLQKKKLPHSLKLNSFMGDSNKNLLEDLYASLKEYLNMRIDEAKLSLSESLAILFGKIILFVLLTVIGAIAFGFLATAFSNWIGALLDSKALGALITGGVFILLMFIIYLFRNKLFTDSMVRMFINMLFKNSDDGKGK